MAKKRIKFLAASDGFHTEDEILDAARWALPRRDEAAAKVVHVILVQNSDPFYRRDGKWTLSSARARFQTEAITLAEVADFIQARHGQWLTSAAAAAALVAARTFPATDVANCC